MSLERKGALGCLQIFETKAAMISSRSSEWMLIKILFLRIGIVKIIADKNNNSNTCITIIYLYI